MVKMRLLCMSVLLVMLLAPLAQGHGTTTLEQAMDEVAEHVEALPIHELPPAEPASPSVEPTVEETQATADRAQAQILLAVDERIEAAETALQPGHQLVDETRGQVDDLLVPDDEPAPDEPEATPQTEASVVQAWPDYAQPVMILTGAAAGLGLLAWFIGQSATVGAGAAGTAAARDGRRFLPFASPLFTRFERDTVLGHPKREAIYGQIIGKPGITLQDLCEESGLSRTAVTHHLRLLEQQHLVVSKRVGRSRHFFENGGRYGRNQKDAYAVLHNDRSKDIHTFIARNPGAIQKDLCGEFAIQASVVHWHVKRLLEANLVEAVRQGRTVSYFPAGDAPQPAYA